MTKLNSLRGATVNRLLLNSEVLKINFQPEEKDIMNPAHWHLVINHVPIIGIILAVLITVYGLAVKSADVLKLSYILLVAVGICSIIAAQTGESAEHYLKSLNAVEETYLEAHAEAADYANYAAIGLAVVSLLTLLVQRIRNFKAMPYIILVFSLVVAGMMARVGSLGGEIMHKEIRADWVASPGGR